jgi:hypothetical protein
MAMHIMGTTLFTTIDPGSMILCGDGASQMRCIWTRDVEFCDRVRRQAVLRMFLN